MARNIYDQVEKAVIGGWRTAATTAGAPVPIIDYWSHEMKHQTQALRDDVRRSVPTKKPRRKTTQ